MSGTYFFLREAVIIRCFRYIWNLNTGAVMPCLIENPVTGNTLCRCHPCDAYESLSEQTENKTFTCHP